MPTPRGHYHDDAVWRLSVWHPWRTSGPRAACAASRLDGTYWLIRLGRPGSRLPLCASVAGLGGVYRCGRPLVVSTMYTRVLSGLIWMVTWLWTLVMLNTGSMTLSGKQALQFYQPNHCPLSYFQLSSICPVSYGVALHLWHLIWSVFSSQKRGTRWQKFARHTVSNSLRTVYE